MVVACICVRLGFFCTNRLFRGQTRKYCHIAEKVATGRKLCGYILRTFRTRNPNYLLTVYKSIVVPVLEYCCIIWNPSKLSQIRSIEQVQRDFTDRLSYPFNMNYWERLKYLNIFSLERRRERYMIYLRFQSNEWHCS